MNLSFHHQILLTPSLARRVSSIIWQNKSGMLLKSFSLIDTSIEINQWTHSFKTLTAKTLHNKTWRRSNQLDQEQMNFQECLQKLLRRGSPLIRNKKEKQPQEAAGIAKQIKVLCVLFKPEILQYLQTKVNSYQALAMQAWWQGTVNLEPKDKGQYLHLMSRVVSTKGKWTAMRKIIAMRKLNRCFWEDCKKHSRTLTPHENSIMWDQSRPKWDL